MQPSLVSDYEKGVVRTHAALLAALATVVLKSSADEILGLGKQPGRRGPAPDCRFLRRIERLHQLSRRDQQSILRTIDAFLSKMS
jgi:hypothetical protein